MEIKKRVQDINKVFDRNWNVNRNNKNREDFLNHRKDYFNKMYNISDKDERRREMLEANSVNSQVRGLNERIKSASDVNRISRMNDLKNNFK